MSTAFGALRARVRWYPRFIRGEGARAHMSHAASLDALIDQPSYPGMRPEHLAAPWVVEPVERFTRKDEARFWFLDFHWPRGLTPLGLVYLTDGYAWGTQLAAEALPLPPGKGLTARVAGTHVYGTELPTASAWELAARAERIAVSLPRFLERFPELWAERAAELERELVRFERFDVRGASLAVLRQLLLDARTFQRRAWEIHFEVMYPLLANYLGFHGLCTELEIDPAHRARFFAGYDTKILECDRGIWALTKSAVAHGLASELAAHEPHALCAALRARTDAASRAWCAELDAFLERFGQRTEGISDVYLAPWVEDPTSLMGTIKTFLHKETPHDFDAAHAQVVQEREAAIDATRARLTRAEQRAFDDALASCQRANFAWWNDEHNHYIDLRATIPLRRAALAIGGALGMERADDTLFLFWPELVALLDRPEGAREVRGLIDERRAFYVESAANRARLPKVAGTVPDEVSDPVLIEIFGMHHHFLDAMRATDDGPRGELRGVAASQGVARGVARVLRTADELHRILPGEILVCEATSPNWTPAFAKIAGCVCDGGGMLTHAAIISREYRIPCVVGVGLATRDLCTGDLVEVDGDRGVVRRIERRP